MHAERALSAHARRDRRWCRGGLRPGRRDPGARVGLVRDRQLVEGVVQFRGRVPHRGGGHVTRRGLQRRGVPGERGVLSLDGRDEELARPLRTEAERGQLHLNRGGVRQPASGMAAPGRQHVERSFVVGHAARLSRPHSDRPLGQPFVEGHGAEGGVADGEVAPGAHPLQLASGQSGGDHRPAMAGGSREADEVITRIAARRNRPRTAARPTPSSPGSRRSRRGRRPAPAGCRGCPRSCRS